MERWVPDAILPRSSCSFCVLPPRSEHRSRPRSTPLQGPLGLLAFAMQMTLILVVSSWWRRRCCFHMIAAASRHEDDAGVVVCAGCAVRASGNEPGTGGVSTDDRSTSRDRRFGVAGRFSVSPGITAGAARWQFGLRRARHSGRDPDTRRQDRRGATATTIWAPATLARRSPGGDRGGRPSTDAVKAAFLSEFPTSEDLTKAAARCAGLRPRAAA
jgi:hypothetical protein